jgi:hypothetical protein
VKARLDYACGIPIAGARSAYGVLKKKTGITNAQVLDNNLAGNNGGGNEFLALN